VGELTEVIMAHLRIEIAPLIRELFANPCPLRGESQTYFYPGRFDEEVEAERVQSAHTQEEE
jgi:hypothetical protein